MMLRQFTRFLAVGAIAAGLNIGSRIMFSVWLAFPLAIALAYLVGLASAFALNRRYVFVDHANPPHQQVFWFTIVNVLALAQTLAVSMVLAEWLPQIGVSAHSETIAHSIGVAAPALTSYIGHRTLSFRRAANVLDGDDVHPGLDNAESGDWTSRPDNGTPK
ncbi:MAG TPA: GtrA family protein [Gammaproteobacteria bacterium]|nr:GtrA family protein [Gammaproteobacteria bacterium]